MITINKSRPIKVRRSKADIDELKATIYRVVEEQHPMTVRQVFYQMVTRGAIDKTENEYKNTIVRLLGEMRLAKELPFEWIADNTRWMRKPDTFSSAEEMFEAAQAGYRQSLWHNQRDYVEVWLEKEALAGVLFEVTAKWDVPLMVTRGYPSTTFIHSAAMTIERVGKPTWLYYFGDHDPSGEDIQRSTAEKLRQFAPYAKFEVLRVAVTPEQIRVHNLPTRPTKETDNRSMNFKGESVEVDAFTPQMLRRMAEDSITWHIDQRQLEIIRLVEQEEREKMERIWKYLDADRYWQAGHWGVSVDDG
jgi:hypothetical protein